MQYMHYISHICTAHFADEVAPAAAPALGRRGFRLPSQSPLPASLYALAGSGQRAQLPTVWRHLPVAQPAVSWAERALPVTIALRFSDLYTLRIYDPSHRTFNVGLADYFRS